MVLKSVLKINLYYNKPRKPLVMTNISEPTELASNFGIETYFIYVGYLYTWCLKNVGQ